MDLTDLSPDVIAALLEVFHPKTIEFAMRIDPYIAHMDKTRGYGGFSVEVKAGELGDVYTDRSYKRREKILP